MRKRRIAGDEQDDGPWEVPAHVGHISTLSEKEPPGVPFERRRHPLGFCIDPAAYARTRKRKSRRRRNPINRKDEG